MRLHGPPGPPSSPERQTAPRHAGLDALRGALAVWVVLHHTAITYGAIGGWYYRELPPDGGLASTLLVFFCTFNQAFFMGLFFLLAGYHTPAALARDGALRYLAGRGLRLGLPLLVYGLLLGPATIALAQTAHGRPFGATLLALWRKGTVEIGPLWFALALLAFSLLAALWPGGWRAPAPACASEPAAPPWPSDRALAWAALATGAAALGLRQVWPVGHSVWGLQLGYFASYTLLFAFGCAAAGPGWLTRLPAPRVRTWRRVAGLALPVLPLVYLALPGERSGGNRLLDIVYAFWEPAVAWGVIAMLLHRFRQPAGPPGALWPVLGRRAYAVFIVHPPVVVAVALAWRAVPAPALLKFAVTGALSVALCLLLAGALLRLPLLRRLL